MMEKGLEQVKKKFVPPGSNIFFPKIKKEEASAAQELARERKPSQVKKTKKESISISQIFHSEWKLKVIS